MTEPSPATAPPVGDDSGSLAAEDQLRAQLKRLSDRFVQLNTRSRSLRLTRCTQSGAFDLMALARHRPERVETIREALGHRDDGEFDLIDSPALTPELVTLERALSTLSQRARDDWQATGLRDLAVGWPFIEGVGADRTWIRAPVFLFPCWVELRTERRSRWALRLAGEPVLNPSLPATLKRLAGATLSIETLLQEDEDKLFAVDEETKAALARACVAGGLSLESDAEVRLETLTTRVVETASQGPKGQFKLVDHLILGRFPPSGSSVIADYERLLDSGETDLGLAQDLLRLDTLTAQGQAPLAADIPAAAAAAQTVSAEGAVERLWRLPLASDGSQDAVLRWLDDEAARGLVVQGPPGTGKSQLIANVISSAIASDMRVLVVCEKRAALDVVYQRLSAAGLSEPLCLVHDVFDDRARVCREISQSLSAVSAGATPEPDDGGALDKVRARLSLSQQAHDGLSRPHNGQPDLTTLALYALNDTRRRLPRLDEVADDVSERDAIAYMPRLGSLAADCLPLAAPHPLSARGDFSDWTPEVAAAHLKELEFFRTELTRVEALRARLTFFKADDHATLWQDAEPLMEVLTGGDSERQHRLVLFWTWTDGHAMSGQWHQVLQALRKARAELDDVPRELVVMRHTELDRWLHGLDQLRHFTGRWLRFVTPLFWRLRGLPSQIRELCPSFTGRWPRLPDERPDDVALQAMVGHAKGWQRLNDRLPMDNPFLNYAFDGSVESLDQAIVELTEHTKLVRAIHGLREAFEPLGGPFREAPDFSGHHDLLQEPFVVAVVQEYESWRRLRVLRERLKDLSGTFDPGLLDALTTAVQSACRGHFRPAHERLNKLVEAWGDVPQAVHLDQLTKNEPAWARQFLKLWRPHRPGAPDPDALSALRTRWQQTRRRGRSARTYEAALVDNVALNALVEDVGHVREAAAAKVQHHYRTRLQQLRESHGPQFRKLLHEAQKVRRRLSLRQLIERYWDETLSLARPVWLCSPDSVSSLFPLRRGSFDLVIFDEASQCPVEAALPIFYRGARAIVAGDEQQMPPSRFFAVSHGVEDDDDSVVMTSDSLLSLATVAFPSLRLTWHYRSRFESLVNFSSRTFYDGELLTAPRPQPPQGAVEGLHFRRVDGLWSSGTNPIEANATVELIERLLTTKDSNGRWPTVGVVTLNAAQMELIEWKLACARVERPTMQAALRRDATRPAHEQLFIRNLENVQGDERDVIVLTTAYGPSADDGKLRARFGPLALAGGDKRLNVAMTRAKQALWVLTSIDPDALSVERSRHPGPKILRAYLRYVRAVSSGDVTGVTAALAEAERAAQRGAHSPSRGLSSRDRLTEQLDQARAWLAEQLVARGLRVQESVGMANKKIDLVVRQSPTSPSVAVDLSQFLLESEPLVRDLYMPDYWRRLGWQLLRVTAARCADDLDGLVDELTRLTSEGGVAR